MRFDLVDRVLEQSAERIVTLKNVSNAEEYLQDHFPSFPVLPGVFMIESMVQAARRLLIARAPSLSRHVLCEVKALKYASFVRPGDSMVVEMNLLKVLAGQVFEFKGSGRIHRPGALGDAEALACVSGRLVMRPASLHERFSAQTQSECAQAEKPR